MWKRKFAWLPITLEPGKVLWWEYYEYMKDEWVCPHPTAMFPETVERYRSRYGEMEYRYTTPMF